MKKLLILIFLSASMLNVISQDKDSIEEKRELKNAGFNKTSHSLFKGKLGNFISNILVRSTFNQGENAAANLNYVPDKDSLFMAGISVSQQIGSSDQQATPFSFSDGLASGTTVGFNLKYIRWNPKLSEKEFMNMDAAFNKYATRHKEIDRRSITYNMVREGGDSEERQLLPKLKKLKTPLFFNLNLAFTKTSFAFATDSTQLTEIDANYITPDISFSVGFQTSATSYFAAAYNYSEIYTSADELSFSLPFGNTGNFFGKTIAFGAPTKTSDNRVSFQWSKTFGQPGAVGINPTLTYGFTSKMLALTLPVYFIKGSADGKLNGLQGGIQLGYLTGTTQDSFNNFKEGFGAQLIIGVPFDVFAGIR